MYTVSDGRSRGSPSRGSDSDSGDRILRRLSKESDVILQRRSARRGRKQDAERKRRERLNHSMIALKELVCGKETQKEDPNSDDSKLEKAQILEATVEYVKQKKKEEEEEHTPPALQFHQGFKAAAQLTVEFLRKYDLQLSSKVQAGLQDFLSQRAKEKFEKGGEREGVEEAKTDLTGKCRSPMKFCRTARHKPVPVLERGKESLNALQKDSPLNVLQKVSHNVMNVIHSDSHNILPKDSLIQKDTHIVLQKDTDTHNIQDSNILQRDVQLRPYRHNTPSQTPSPAPSPRSENPAYVPPQSFGHVPPTSAWMPAVYPVAGYPSPTASPLQRYTALRAGENRGDGPLAGFVSPVVSGPQVWARSGPESLQTIPSSATAPYCVRDASRLNTPHNDSGYFSPTVAAVSPFSPYTTPRGVYLPNHHVTKVSTPGVLNLSNPRIHSDAQHSPAALSPSDTISSENFSSEKISTPCVSPDSVADAYTPRRAHADSTRTIVTSSTGSRVPVTPPLPADDSSRDSVFTDTPGDKEITCILSAPKSTVPPVSSRTPSPVPDRSSPAPNVVPSDSKMTSPASKVTSPERQVAAPVCGSQPKSTWRPW